MPNPLGRRRGSSAASDEISQLKRELAELKDAYVQDMALISSDMSQLESKLPASGTVNS
jgi:hypothetical protein